MKAKDVLKKIGLFLSEMEGAETPTEVKLASGESVYVKPSLEVGSEILSLEGEEYVAHADGKIELYDGSLVEVEEGKIKDILKKTEDVELEEFKLSKEEFTAITETVEEMRLKLNEVTEAYEQAKGENAELIDSVNALKDAVLALEDEPAADPAPVTPSTVDTGVVSFAERMAAVKAAKGSKIQTR